MFKLKHCPFCGNENLGFERKERFLDKILGWRVCCPHCGATGYLAKTEKLAAEAWNKRRVGKQNGKLAHCPWCGSSLWADIDVMPAEKKYVGCTKCAGKGPRRSTKKGAENAWNRRAK